MQKEEYRTGRDLIDMVATDILIRLNISNREPEVVEHEDDIVKQIINNYKRDLERWNKELDELLAPKTTGNEQYVPRNDKVYYWWKKNK